MCCSKYSHSRVTSFKTHLKHNNDFTKLIYEEKHLPQHMRLTFNQRFWRFLFMPITLFACVLILDDASQFKTTDELCQLRNECYSYCTYDNFPALLCDEVSYELEYN